MLRSVGNGYVTAECTSTNMISCKMRAVMRKKVLQSACAQVVENPLHKRGEP